MTLATNARPRGLMARIAAAHTTCKIADHCSGEQRHEVRLATMRQPVVLCDACLEAAKTLGMSPSPVPAWMKGSLARDETGRLVS